MDNLDAKIIQELSGPGSYQWDARQSYSAVGRKLGVDEVTIRRRITRLEQSGHLGGSELIPNPYLIGREPVAMVFGAANSGREDKQEKISEIKLVDGVVMIADMQGDELQVLLYCENERALARRTQLISRLSRAKNPMIIPNVGFPVPEVGPTRTDLLIIKSLRKDPRKSAANVAVEIGASTRTVERRIRLLTENNAFFHVLRTDLSKSQGVTCSISVSYRDSKTKSELDQTIGGKLKRVVFSMTSMSMFSQFTFVSDNITEAEETHEWVRGLDGVKQARMGMIKELILVTDWIGDEIESRLATSNK